MIGHNILPGGLAEKPVLTEYYNIDFTIFYQMADAKKKSEISKLEQAAGNGKNAGEPALLVQVRGVFSSRWRG